MTAGRGRFITLEGIEGVGKSTNAAFVAELIKANGHRVVMTREPGGTALAEGIRGLLLHGEAIPPIAELLMMFAARASHLESIIEPALNRGEWVICDRFTDASYAYQGGGRGLPIEWISTLESWIQGPLRPDLVIVLDADVEVALARAKARRNPADRFEKEAVDFYRRVREVYLTRARQPNYVIVDADQPLRMVRQALRKTIHEWDR